MKTYKVNNKNTKVIVYFLLAMVVYTLMLTVTIPTLRSHMNGIEVFDLRPMGYTIEEGQAIIDGISEIGSQYYQQVQLPLDFIYPFLLTLFAMSFLNRLSIARPSLKRVIWFPLTILVFDYLENIGIYAMLNGFTSDFMIQLSSTVTILKSLSTTIVLTGLLILVVDTVILKIKSKNKERQS